MSTGGTGCEVAFPALLLVLMLCCFSAGAFGMSPFVGIERGF